VKFLPYDSFVIDTDLSREQARKKIASVTTPLEKYKGLDYHGTIEEYHFKIRKHSSVFSRNDFRPVIYGDITELPNGSRITIEQKLPPFVKNFLMIWMGLLGLFLLSSVDIMIRDKTASPLIHCVFMEIGGYAVATIGFWVDAVNTKKDLEEMFHVKH